MSRIESMGTIDGQPAKIVYLPERHQTHIFWGGLGSPDGPRHNHAVVQDANPDAIHFLRQNGVIVTDLSQPGRAAARRIDTALMIARILRDSWRRALEWWGFR